MVRNRTECSGTVSNDTGCLNCAKCESEMLSALPRIRADLVKARNANDHYEEGRLQAQLTSYEIALRNME